MKAVLDKPIKTLKIKSRVIEADVDVFHIFNRGHTSLEDLTICGHGYHALRPWKEQPPSMASLTSLRLEYLEIVTCVGGLPVRLELPQLRELFIMERCKGEISPESRFPSLLSFNKNHGHIINGLVVALQTTATRLKTIEVAHPHDIVVTDHLEELTIHYEKEIYPPHEIHTYFIGSSLIRIVHDLIKTRPPLRRVSLITNGKYCDVLYLETQKLVHAFPRARINVTINNDYY